MREAVYLYVEDDPLSQEIMKMIVSFGMGSPHLIIFASSDNFMARVQALTPKPTVFLLDIHIEPHDGFEMLKMLRQDSQFDACPIIALTASVMNEEVDQLRRSGFDGAIGKPLSVQTFPALIKRILDGESVWHIA